MVIDATDNGTGMAVTVRVSRVDAGDEALVLAADGVLGMFSVGVDPTDWSYDQAGTMHVHAADWRELSLLTIGAFSDARVATVTAAQPEEPMDLTKTVAELDPEPVDPDDAPTPPSKTTTTRRRRPSWSRSRPPAPPPSRCAPPPAPVAARSGSTCVAWRRSWPPGSTSRPPHHASRPR